jgi:protocatechuate 3,4-dioxygenase beta subunit
MNSDVSDPDSHHHGLIHDLPALERLRIGRRRALFLLGASGTAMLGGCGGESGSTGTTSTVSIPTTSTPTPSPTPTPTPTPTSSSSQACAIPATETNGPYPADGTNTSQGVTSNVLVASGIIRSDIRSSFIGSGTAIASGVLVDITITLVDANNSCTPLAGYAVYVWHCDAGGNYSLYNLPNESYLRGVQISDSNGQVKFKTIFPGCYAGRYPHIHFEVFSSASNATGGRYAVLISQFAMPAAQCTAVYATTGYSSSASNFRNISIASDGIFGDNSAAQMAVMTLQMAGDVASGYTATSTIAIAT